MSSTKREKLKTFFRRTGNALKRLIIALIAISAIVLVGLLVERYLLPPGVELPDIPEYSGSAVIELNNGVPGFDDGKIWTEPPGGPPYEQVSELDSLGRVGRAVALVGPETMPEGEREESTGMARPTGWHYNKYDFIDNGGYLYNRCHLIGWHLTGNLDEYRLLVTGTRYMNVEGMLPYENRVASYVRRTGNHVMYRVTPIFEGRNRLAKGVQMEAYSVEDAGEGLSFNVFCYNVQPGVIIDYETGENWEE